ncbi:hypothetical protein JJN09_04180 [Pseudomonas sp. HS6]|nr:hypothetical protein JJN09_04180 [Pseudomonas sp. HS6]
MMTPAQQGVFFELLKNQVPSWALQSSDELRVALYESLKASFHSRNEVNAELNKFKSPEQFCAPLLAEAMAGKLGEPLQVEGVIFQHIRYTSSLHGLRKKLVLPIAQDLLTAACDNFEASETVAENDHERSLIYIPEKITGHSNKILPIKPHEFAQLCRTLDLGEKYQRHVSDVFGGEDQSGTLRGKAVAFSRDNFDVERHVACMRGFVSVEVHEMLASVSKAEPTIRLANNTLGYQRLEMLGFKVYGPMFIGPVTEHDDEDYRCVVFVPGDPEHPLKEYESFTRFEMELSRRLRNPDYLKFFLRFIALKDRPGFLSALNDELSVRPSTLPLETLYVRLFGFDLDADVSSDLFAAMFRLQAAHVRADARLLVVPTDDEDEKSRLARLEQYESIGLNVLLFFASFVPVVGEVMFAMAGLQLLGTVYEGISSWAKGEQEQATDYLFDTLENLILMAATAGAATVVSGAYRVVKASGVVLKLREVSLASGGMRLWKPELSAYRDHRVIPPGVRADGRGLIWRDNHGYLSMGAEQFVVRPRLDTELWEIQPPRLSGRYSPELETNGAGAWRHDSELPHDWEVLTLFRRLGYRKEDVSDTRARQILDASGVDAQALRQLFVDRRKPMAILTDTVRRFHADSAVATFIEKVGDPASALLSDADLQLFLLTSSTRWPQDRAVSVTNVLGKEVTRYGSSQVTRLLQINEEQLAKGEFHSALLAGLTAADRVQLLGGTAADQSGELARLIKLITEKADDARLTLFDRLYRRIDLTGENKAEPLRRAFPGLPASVAEELAHNADSSEWQELAADRVPLRLAEEARRYEQVLALNRAYEGLYLDAASGFNTDLVVLDTLGQLPGWPKDVFVQIREWAVDSQEGSSVGSNEARYRVFIDAYPERYEGNDASATLLTSHPVRTRAHFFQTLWEVLPAHARKALGVEIDDGGVTLREKITALALQRREALTRLVGKEAPRAGYSSPMGLADRLVEQSMWLAEPVPGQGTANRPSALVHRARELYPSHSSAQIEHFLLTLGGDEVLALRALEARRQSFESMRNTLERWVHRESHYQVENGPLQVVPRHTKARATQAILRAWRKESGIDRQSSHMLYKLTFDRQPLGDLPVIVGDFSHIGTLEMDNVGASAGLQDFLRNFTNLQRLSLAGNELTRVPEAVADMERLTHLDLSYNRVYLTPEALIALGTKQHLRSLNLSFNPAIGRLPSILPLQQLQHLALRATGIAEWPEGVTELAQLQSLDLRDNRIATLPDAVFAARIELNRGTNVDGNPLSPSTLSAIAAYQRLRGISLGVLTANYRRRGLTPPRADAGGENWVGGLSLAETALMQDAWIALNANPSSRDFFLVLNQLRDTADYARLHTEMAQRVWNLLQAATESEELRTALFRMARIGRVSANEASGLFSDMEVRVLCYRAMNAARSGVRSLEAELVRLLRGLFRLQEVERQALIEISRRTQTGDLSRQQALELSLIYRVGLAQRLDLPAQPRVMNVVLGVELTPLELDRAYEAVVRAEHSPVFLESVEAQAFWSQYLETTYQGQFDVIVERTAQAMSALDAQTELPRAEATQRLAAIVENFRNERAQLRKTLTGQALARHPGLPLPGPAPTPRQSG